MTWLRPVDRTSGTLTLNAGTLSCLAHHGTLLSERRPTTTALEHTTVPMDDANRMSPLGAVAALWITSKKFCGFAALRDFEAAFDRSGSAGGRDAKRAR